MKALFGPAGNSLSFIRQEGNVTVKAPAWLAGMGLDAYEYQCGRGVNIGKQTAGRIGEQARVHGIALSLHAPYYISLTSGVPERVEANLRYILQSVRAAAWMGAARVVVHAGSMAESDRPKAIINARSCIQAALSLMEQEGISDITLCLETMGKVKSLGSLDEVTALCACDERLLPCVDFGHLYARSQGALTTDEQFIFVFDALEHALGLKRARRMHIHFSKIEYSSAGEVRHLTFDNDQYGPEFAPAARILREREYCPVVICESAGTQAEDALKMKTVFFSGA